MKRSLFTPGKENQDGPYAKAVKGIGLEDIMQRIDGFANSVNDNLGRLNATVSSVESNVKVIRADLTGLTNKVQIHDRLLGAQYRQRAMEYLWDHPNYVARSCNLRATGQGIEAMLTEVGDTRAPGARAAVGALLRSKFADSGLQFAAGGDLFVTGLQPAKTLPSGRQVRGAVYFTAAIQYRDALVSKAVKTSMSGKGVEYWPSLNAIELENKRFVKSHAKFKLAMERPGVRPIWRLDWCCLESKWPDNAPEKLFNVFTLAPHTADTVDLMNTDG